MYVSGRSVSYMEPFLLASRTLWDSEGEESEDGDNRLCLKVGAHTRLGTVQIQHECVLHVRTDIQRRYKLAGFQLSSSRGCGNGS